MKKQDVKKILGVALVLQVLLWVLVGLSYLGYDIIVLRQVIGLVYLVFLPGAILLHILKIRNFSHVENFLYSVGLSIALVMFVGLFINALLPMIGVPKPMSTVPFLISMTAVVLTLCFVAYLRGETPSTQSKSAFSLRELFSPPALALISLPILSILGTQLVNYYQNNTVLMILLIIIALIVVLVGFDKFIPHGLYPLAIVAVGLALLFLGSLISRHITGWDITGEYQNAKLVLINGRWDSSVNDLYNSVLSVVMLAPACSEIMQISLVPVFKIVYPLIFSLVPLGLFQLFRSRTNDKTAFFGVFFFVAINTFFAAEIWICREQIAMLFLVLLMLVLTNDQFVKTPLKILLMIIFGAGLAVSHYSLSYLFVALLFSSLVILHLRVGREKTAGIPKSFAVTVNFAIMFTILVVSWYMLTSRGIAFQGAVNSVNSIVQTFSHEFLNSNADRGAEVILRHAAPLHTATIVLNTLTDVFIAIGVLGLIFKRKVSKLGTEFSAFAISSFVICVASLIVPSFAAFGTARVYHVTLIFLAPFCVIGGLVIIEAIPKIGKLKTRSKISYEQTELFSFKVFSIILAVLLLFNSGFLYQLANEYPISISLSQQSIQNGDTSQQNQFYNAFDPEADVFGAIWLGENANSGVPIYSDFDANQYVLRAYTMSQGTGIALSSSTVVNNMAYIFLRQFNIEDGIIVLSPDQTNVSLNSYAQIFQKAERVYSNGGSEIYYNDTSNP